MPPTKADTLTPVGVVGRSTALLVPISPRSIRPLITRPIMAVLEPPIEVSPKSRKVTALSSSSPRPWPACTCNTSRIADSRPRIAGEASFGIAGMAGSFGLLAISH